MKNTINKNIYPWIMKWHFIGGIISAPILVILAITGLIYLFKDSYEAPQKQALTHIEQKAENKMSYQQQWELAKAEWEKEPTGVTLPGSEDETTEFFSGMFSHKSNLYIDPYAQRVTGIVNINDTDMNQVRKLHGELLLGSYGTKVVELVASWMVVLIITGLFLFWPRGRGWQAFFTVRSRQGKRMLYRDLHALSGFWLSLLLLIVLAGGLPWTDVFGSGFKWVQEKTGTGYPVTWDSRTLTSKPVGEAMSLDEVMSKAADLKLEGKTIIDLPQSPTGVYSIYNETNVLSAMRKIHLDQYTSKVLVSHSWADVGVLMKARLWVMAFHQGEFGLWNWYLMIFVALSLLLLSVSAIVSYFLRKQPKTFSVPKVPDNFSPGMVLVIIIVLMGIALPLFGLSVACLFLISKLKQKIYLQPS
ncbi:PepSY-associated TM helix domain-containing protein [Cyclobacterium plantarum]|uniref:PepSY-associated TM helix domain-containing protein n=1 Tax=Cyclobacterium plantarum TaxID=2716263 RepID=UPI003F730CB8